MHACWSQYQVRSDKAIRRHWQLVCCAFSFCWYHASHPISKTTEEALARLDPEASLSPSVPAISPGTGKKKQRGNTKATRRVLAHGLTSGPGAVGAVDHAFAL